MARWIKKRFKANLSDYTMRESHYYDVVQWLNELEEEGVVLNVCAVPLMPDILVLVRLADEEEEEGVLCAFDTSAFANSVN